ncbi:MAG: hypothetical protein D6737_06520 [Chloroflexi bacterium]|nr:MAG: hypothetical protein D6737_06520 [Chloroflexota bacterium]
MAFEAKWCVDKRVVYVRYYDDVSLDDFKGASAAMRRYLEEGEGPLVHNIVDFSEAQTIPTHVGKGRQSLPHLGHPKFGWTIIVKSDNPLVLMITSIMAQTVQQRYRAVDSRDEAVEFLKYVDSTIENAVWQLEE